jgi:DUF4097 and DUF4098 domain-containing protein YvlB
MSREPLIHTFQTPTAPKLRVEIPRGRILVEASETGQTEVILTAHHGDGDAMAWIAEAEIGEVGGEIVVRNPHRSFFGIMHCGPIEAQIRTATGAAASLSIGAGRIETSGRLGAVSATTGAGQIRIEACSEARVRTGSGNVEVLEATGGVDAKTGAGTVTITRTGGDARVTTGAGNARLGEIGGLAHLTTGHGNVEIGHAGEAVEAFTASGNIDVARADRGRVRAKTVSGRVSVGVPSGVSALLDVSTLSGRVRSDLAASGPPADGEPHVELVLSTVSGNVNVARA